MCTDTCKMSVEHAPGAKSLVCIDLKESLGYTVLTGVCLAHSSKKKSYIPIHQKSSFVFPKNLTLYWAPKKEQEQENKFGFHGFQYKGAVNYQHNYRTQTLSSNSLHVAGTSQVNKAYNEKSSSKGLDK